MPWVDASARTKPSPPSTSTHEAKRVEMALTVRRIFDVHTKDQRFTTRLLIQMRWEMPPGEEPPPREEDDGDWVPNWTPKLRVKGMLDEQMTQQYTTEVCDEKTYVNAEILILVTISEMFELHKFPNDCQDLTIELLCNNPSTQCLWVSPPGGQLVETVSSGMYLDDFELLHECPFTANLFLEHSKQGMHSCLQVKVKVVRQCRYYVINVAFVMFLICTFVLCAWAVHPGAIADRWSVDFSLVLTAVAFKLILNDMLPRLSYLTTLDIYVLSGFLFLSVATFCHSVLPLGWHSKVDYSALTLPPLSVEDELAVIDADLISFYAAAGVWLLWNLAYTVYFNVSRKMEISAFTRAAISAQETILDSDNEVIDRQELTEQPPSPSRASHVKH
eukprot:TRINITY_DN14964_c0_g2_i3.p1 TRINITY_DN14964_c0_g2~~TRINITY_DN14964_c0_g2_i3.p1  ORF type:complete len:452 (-),score=78.47 TRINITY_DN14964_c0_g2_i3:27-1193(-)